MSGYRWRAIQPGDHPAIHRMARLVEAADDYDETLSLERLTWELCHDVRDLERDSLVGFAPDGTPVAAGWISKNQGGTRKHRIFWWFYIHPGHRSTGAGEAFLARIERRGRELLSQHDDELPAVFRSWAYAENEYSRRLHEAAGYRAVRYFETMRRPLAAEVPAPPPPAGIEIGAWEDANLEPVRLAHNAAFADHWGSEPMDRDVWRSHVLDDPNFRPDLSFIARAGDEIAGYLIAEVYPEDFDGIGFSEGWIGTLGVPPGFRRRGLASALVARSLQALRVAGLEYATLVVDSENPNGASGLYGRLGFVPARRSITYVKEATT